MIKIEGKTAKQLIAAILEETGCTWDYLKITLGTKVTLRAVMDLLNYTSDAQCYYLVPKGGK